MNSKGGKFELIASMKAGYCRNQTLSSDSIQITPQEDKGKLELFCKKVSVHVDYESEDIEFSEYELRWQSLEVSSESKPIIVPLSYQQEFVKYDDVKDGVVFVLRQKEAWKDHSPYFFWCQEAESSSYSRFLTSFHLAFDVMTKEKAQKEYLNRRMPFDAVRYINEEKVESIFENPEICKRLYPFVPECLRTPSGLRKIVHSPSFRKNITLFQMAMNMTDVATALSTYNVKAFDLPNVSIDTNDKMKLYMKSIEEWAKEQVKKEQK